VVWLGVRKIPDTPNPPTICDLGTDYIGEPESGLMALSAIASRPNYSYDCQRRVAVNSDVNTWSGAAMSAMLESKTTTFLHPLSTLSDERAR
jgi:hypothetical protein